MQQNRTDDQDMPSRSANMEPAEGSRETIMNSESPGADLGTSSDRAMFDERMRNEERDDMSQQPGERGSGRSGERNSSNTGGISNRDLGDEQSRQDRVPDRGRTQSER